jgi:hypothetical protein
VVRTDKRGNFRECHDFLKLDGKPIRHFLNGVPPETMVEVDRKAHRYSFRIDGTVTRISATLHVAIKHLQSDPSGSLAFTIWLLPEGTPSPAAAARREEAARQEAAEAEQVAKENSALRAKLESLRCLARFENHFLDPKFQEDFAKHNPTAILQTKRPEWQKQYAQFMEDASLKSLAEAQAPEVIQWFEARVKIAQLAERMMVAPPENQKPKNKLKVHEVRQLIVHREAVQVDDKIARAKLKGEKIAQAKTEMDALPLDDDEKERLKAELVQKIFEEGEEHGKDGVTL